MTFESFDDPELDGALSSGLSALAPELEPADTVLNELRPRFQRARRRRRVVQTSAAMTALLVIGGVAFAEAPVARRSHVTVESPDGHTDTTHRRTPSTSAHSTTTTPKPRNLSAGSAPTSTSQHTQVLPTVTPTTAAPTSDYPPSSATTPPPTSAVHVVPPPTHPPTPTTVPLPKPVRYYSYAGSVLVRLVHGQMLLLQVLPKDGYVGDVHVKRPLKIDVWFNRHGQMVSRVELIVVDGHIKQIRHSTFASDQGKTWDGRRVMVAGVAAGHHGTACPSKPLTKPAAQVASGPVSRSGDSDATASDKSDSSVA